jgi:hypothetical protein
VYAGGSGFCWLAVEAQDAISRGSVIVTEDRTETEDSTMPNYHVVMSLHAGNDKIRVAAPRLLLEGRLTTDSRGKGGRSGWSRPAPAGGQIGPRHLVRPSMSEGSRRTRTPPVQSHGTKSFLAENHARSHHPTCVLGGRATTQRSPSPAVLLESPEAMKGRHRAVGMR